MAARKKYGVQRYFRSAEEWLPISFTETGLPYCRGYVDAMDSLYPSPPYRVVEYVADDTIRVVQETRGNGAPHTN